VLDEWFEGEARPRLAGRSMLVRFADDFVMAFESFEDAQRVRAVLAKRLGRYGLELHADKTRFIDFRKHPPADKLRTADRDGQHPHPQATSFDFLGFTLVWGKSRKGKRVIRLRTAKSRYARALARVNEWCRRNRHRPIPEQQTRLSAMMRGHYAYYGVTGNFRRVQRYAAQIKRVWKQWLSRRDRTGYVNWSRMQQLLDRHPLPVPRIVHRYAIGSEPLT
jgi:RNA-directed DNA polymerase